MANLFQPDPEGDYSGLLIAAWLDLPVANAIALPGGEPAEQLHITLCYCGDAGELSDVQIARAIAGVSDVAMMFGPLTGSLNGLLRFNASGSSEGLDVFAAQVDVPGLESMRQNLALWLDMAGCPASAAHGYTPHVTLAYLAPDADLPTQRLATQPITIRSLWIGVGDRRTEIPLVGSYYKAGARHSTGDMKMLQTIHDHATALGASCGGKAINPHLFPARFRYLPEEEAGNALKAVSQTDSELRVANYMVLFGGRDLEGTATKRRNQDGSRGEYFTKATKFDSSYTDLGVLYVDWEHGMYGGAGEPGQDDVLGYVDWKSARIDDKGLFVERVLNRRNKYVQYIEQLITDGLIGNSSQAVGDQVQKAVNGEIVKWPLLRDTLTVAPMEPRMITANSLAALKALSAVNPAFVPIVEQAEQHAKPEAAPEAASKTAAAAAARALLLELDLLELETGV